MGHGPSTEWGKDHSADYKTKLGIVLFILYSLVYAAFVVLNVIWPKTMDMLIGEQNLSVVYGLGLIVGALLLGMVYNHMCTKAEDRSNPEQE